MVLNTNLEKYFKVLYFINKNDILQSDIEKWFNDEQQNDTNEQQAVMIEVGKYILEKYHYNMDEIIELNDDYNLLVIGEINHIKNYIDNNKDNNIKGKKYNLYKNIFNLNSYMIIYEIIKENIVKEKENNKKKEENDKKKKENDEILNSIKNINEQFIQKDLSKIVKKMKDKIENINKTLKKEIDFFNDYKKQNNNENNIEKDSENITIDTKIKDIESQIEKNIKEIDKIESFLSNQNKNHGIYNVLEQQINSCIDDNNDFINQYIEDMKKLISFNKFKKKSSNENKINEDNLQVGGTEISMLSLEKDTLIKECFFNLIDLFSILNYDFFFYILNIIPFKNKMENENIITFLSYIEEIITIDYIEAYNYLFNIKNGNKNNKSKVFIMEFLDSIKNKLLSKDEKIFNLTTIIMLIQLLIKRYHVINNIYYTFKEHNLFYDIKKVYNQIIQKNKRIYSYGYYRDTD